MPDLPPGRSSSQGLRHCRRLGPSRRGSVSSPCGSTSWEPGSRRGRPGIAAVWIHVAGSRRGRLDPQSCGPCAPRSSSPMRERERDEGGTERREREDGRERYRARRRSPRQIRSRSWTRVVARATERWWRARPCSMLRRGEAFTRRRRARRRGGGARDLACPCAAERPSHAGEGKREGVGERGSGRGREREGVGEAFTLATEGVRASRVVVGWRCSSRVARWERRLGMRGKRTETLSAHFIPVPATGLALDLLGLGLNRGGLYRMPTTVHRFTVADLLICPPRKIGIFYGGHIKRSATVNRFTMADALRCPLR